MKILDKHNSKKRYTLLLAHGAGADGHSDFIVDFKNALESFNVQVIRFNFPYMVEAEKQGKRRPPDRMPKLLDAFEQAIDAVGKSNIWIGGKSMGGRVATLLNGHPKVAGVIALGYPFHPPGKPDKLRTEHLLDVDKPIHILQGERDTFGNLTEVPTYTISKKITITWIPDGDHSFKPRKASGRTLGDNIQLAASRCAEIIKA